MEISIKVSSTVLRRRTLVLQLVGCMHALSFARVESLNTISTNLDVFESVPETFPALGRVAVAKQERGNHAAAGAGTICLERICAAIPVKASANVSQAIPSLPRLPRPTELCPRVSSPTEPA